MTIREKWFGGFAMASIAALLGSIVARLLSGVEISWEGLSAVVAMIALPVAIIGYLDNRTGQRLEHRAYISLQVRSLELAVGVPTALAIELTNYGRTPAHETQMLVTLGIWPDNINDLPRAARPQKITESSVHPNSPSVIYTDAGFVITQVEYDAVQAGVTQLAIHAVCIYRDVFGDRHETHLMGRIQTVGDSIRVLHADVGNWAS